MCVQLKDIAWARVEVPNNVVPEGGGLLMGFSFHTGKLW